MQQKILKTRKNVNSKKYKEELIFEVLKSYLSSSKSIKDVSEYYSLPMSTICSWYKDYKQDPKKYMDIWAKQTQKAMSKTSKPTPSEELTSLQEEVTRLKKELEKATMSSEFYQIVVEEASNLLNIDLLKKYGASQLRNIQKKGRKPK
jgi:transposase-like protein